MIFMRELRRMLGQQQGTSRHIFRATPIPPNAAEAEPCGCGPADLKPARPHLRRGQGVDARRCRPGGNYVRAYPHSGGRLGAATPAPSRPA